MKNNQEIFLGYFLYVYKLLNKGYTIITKKYFSNKIFLINKIKRVLE